MVDQLATAAAPALLQAGMRLGQYHLLRRLAVGGMAELYLARAVGIEGFQKLLVLKRILPQHAASQEFVTMFLDEARLAATLHHPNIAQTYDMGVEDGSYFFTMEYVHGENMRSVLRAVDKRREQLPFERAVSIVLGISAGLHHAHEQVGPDGEPLGIVHRDVSPSNVLVGYDGAVKIVDFGIAKAASQRVDTNVGTLKGKIAYMSPEQCRGERPDRRSDVFAIGILLFEFTTQTRLFTGENEFSILKQVVSDDVPPPSSRRSGYPPDLEAIVMKALRRNPDERFATAQELQLALERFARDERLVVSNVALGAYMKTLFGERVDPWRELSAAVAADALAGAVPARQQPKPKGKLAIGSALRLDSPPDNLPTPPDAMAVRSGDATTNSTANETGDSTAAAPTPTQNSPWIFILAAALAAGALAVFVQRYRHGGDLAPSAPALAPKAVAAPTAPIPAPVPAPAASTIVAPALPNTDAANVAAAVIANVTQHDPNSVRKSRKTNSKTGRKVPTRVQTTPTKLPAVEPAPSPNKPWDPDSPLPP